MLLIPFLFRILRLGFAKLGIPYRNRNCYINEVFKADEGVECLFQRDIYSGAQWCELLPARATKAAAALELKELLGCEKLVVFGDGINDLSLFRTADECYAVENAAPELKEIATAVIGANNDDGVAKWIEAL